MRWLKYNDEQSAIGQLMPLLGRDWSHQGVAKLFHAIARNGFQPVYLTSRAIGQANITRQYIRGLRQDGVFLPDGPILMSPDRLMASFRREVIDRQPQIFKIMALTELKHLFPPWHNPFWSGFGNRITDILAYKGLLAEQRTRTWHESSPPISVSCSSVPLAC
jgi:phosphatidate phosphatase LPIN